ncbi:HNH endonuclease signature motif containing protein [Nocardiopsis baichengensis]|uniref:HNH endonuclease signature motif containing protein n=1 Tax=Nocardiopsis baichengensis TaxID=280240 RepID=UPI000366BA73|nr:HNH endonuclease signature motif containing protein [Nocardiopsis baichengensis]
MADQRHPGIPAGSRSARIRAGISGVLAEAQGAVGEDLAPGAGRVLCELAGVLAAGQGQLDLALARLAARIGEAGALAGSGHSTVAGLLRANGRSISQANAVTTVADHLGDYPQAVRSAEAGEIAFGQLALVMDLSERAVAGRCTDRHPEAGDYRAKAEDIMVQAAASGAGDRMLRRIGRELPQRISPQEHEEQNRDAYGAREARFTDNAFGFALHVQGDAASAEIIRTAVEAHTTPPDERTPAQRRFDALVQLCENRLAAEGLPVPVPEEGSDAATALNAPRVEQGTRRRGVLRPQVSVVVPLEALLGAEGAAPATTDRGRLLPPSAVRAFASDSILRRLVTDPVEGVVDIGRARRTFPTRIREALVATAGTCQWEEGCSVPARWCQGDHRTEWWEGGATALGNAQLLCGRHNREKHMRRLQAHYRARASGAGGHRDTTRRPERGPGGDDDDGPLTEAA